MEQPSQIWQSWANSLNRWGLQNLTVTFLNALGPLNLFGAQMVYLGQPLLSTFIPAEHLDALANLLEDPKSTQAFVSILQQSDDPSRV